MTTRKKRSTADVDALLEALLVDAYGDDEQLTALVEGIDQDLDFPIDVHVVGEPLSLVSLDYDGNPRRGVVARCRREDGTEYRVSLADVELSPDAPGYLHLAAYCRWLGVDPAAPKRGVDAKSKVRKHKAGEDDIDLSKPIDLIVVRVKERAARCRLVGSERVITLRAGSIYGLVPGQIATVQPKKHWRHHGHPYLSGEIVSARIDAVALGLAPLAVREEGEWDPADEDWGEEGEPIEDWAAAIIARGSRPMFEMEQVLPGSAPDDDFDSDPILEANELRDTGDEAASEDLLATLLETDPRCLDAHAHLGHLQFGTSPRWAAGHYEVGVRVGELSLGDDFDGLLPWSLLDNRPFLRCLHGYGICLWREGRWEEAERVFERMLELNPSDEQGIRVVLPDVRARKAWVNDENAE